MRGLFERNASRFPINGQDNLLQIDMNNLFYAYQL